MDRRIPARDRRRITVVILAVSAFATALNYLLLGPLLKPIGRDFGMSDAVVGQLAAMQAAMAAAIALLVAPWMDRFDRRRLLRLELATLIAATLVTALAPGFAWLLVGRAVAGIGGATIFGLCLAIAGDVDADAGRRNQTIGAIWAAGTMAGVAGVPFVSQIASLAGWRWGAALLLLPLILGWVGTWGLPATPATTATGGPIWRDWLTGYRRVLGHRQTSALLAATVVLFVVWQGWTVYLGASAVSLFGLGATALSLLYLTAGGAQFLASVLSPALLRWLPTGTVFVAATVVFATGLLLLGDLRAGPWAVFPLVAVAALAAAAVGFAANILLLDSLPAARGTVMSLQSAGMEIGIGLGAGLGGLALTVGGYPSLYRAFALLLPLSLVGLAVSGSGAHRKEAPTPEPVGV